MQLEASIRLQAADGQWHLLPRPRGNLPGGIGIENFDGKGSVGLVIPDFNEACFVVAVQGGTGVSDWDIDIPFDAPNAFKKIVDLLRIRKVPVPQESLFLKGFKK